MAMKYVLMCGGNYTEFNTPKQLSWVNGERLADRTIRLLKEAGAEEIYISSNNPMFDSCGVPRLTHENNFSTDGKGHDRGYWLDAFYPNFEATDKVAFLYGDVYYTENAINMIVNYKTDKNILFGTSDAKNKEHQNWGEPFAYIVNNYRDFMNGIKAVKQMQDEGLLLRTAITWELYRYLNRLDVNVQRVLDETYVVIDDGTMDIDDPKHIERMNARFK
jgi:choline kinase